MNKRRVWGRDKYLVQWKGCTVKEDTWKSQENLKNASDLVKEFERRYEREEKEEAKRQEKKENKRIFNRELPGKYMVKLLYRWGKRKYK